ncbi:UDP-N-acetylmuramoylalanine--D-glutamate ligase [Candidatus Roizmanbacteria bacterium RIFCSPHIGHO2_01_FULL_35_10]|uniref:UDP-N-acetylmuramoylalanine--D-glutamate ligase n=1 Tax=Candidatus Roizmanbacteria bacterium RIFCSPLOWO2_01_FULL_35_13 TaxID=1802055 RepID=A0A1F7IHD3_9BACT|nr:MAG: UDP-N-acetylmuramoylalanine--D-glutamate ligase [Candidatus Roizmanbacteria bacterium RIFCSPHIGHO2_01_FULL_35_10]OGK42767.1 MAG: UDP-N-acetylmuramoylalanine--D-glutamate ligase [Candidatus Roizmanbacteria bacterium RIFCSPLOWO2_01_FULL_35_13]
MNILSQVKQKKILILGLGREGLSTYLFLRKQFPDKILTLADKFSLNELPKSSQVQIAKDKKVKLSLGKGYLKEVRGFDLVFVTPGISDTILEKVKETQTIISTNLELFFELFKGKIIGVTGTKGKSTTASLIFHVLKQSGLNAILAGNIGEPALSYLDDINSDSLVVLELSSFQLMRFKKSPYIAVIQNIVPEHLDYHLSFKKYVEAKTNIVNYQTKNDFVIYNSTSILATEIAQKSRAKKISFSLFSKEFEKTILPIKSIPLRGKFNLQNIIPAILIGRLLGISDKKIGLAIKNFKPLEHRLEFIRSIDGVEYYNDSLSTIPESAIAAIETFPDKYKVLILGGYDRGLDFKKLAKVIYSAKIRGIILFPTTGKKIWEVIKKIFKNKNLPQSKFVTNMKDAVKQVFSWAKKGDVVLLSPASPSFSGFKDYKDRGDQFKKEVLNLQQKT